MAIKIINNNISKKSLILATKINETEVEKL